MLFAVFGWIALAGALCWPFLLYRIISKASKDRSAGVECFLLALLSLDFLSLAVYSFYRTPCFINASPPAKQIVPSGGTHAGAS